MATVTLKVYSQSGKEVSTLPVSEKVFASEVNEQAMFNAVNVYLANRRQATAKTKKRSEVSGGGKKPFRQKGTGRARSGSRRSPVWKGGGTVFGPTGEQNFKLKQNKKEHRLALRSAFTTKVNDLIVLDKLTVKEGKTKEIVQVLKALKTDTSKVLLVTSDDLVYQAANNLANVQLTVNNNIAVYDLLNNDKVILLVDDVKVIEEGLVNA